MLDTKRFLFVGGRPRRVILRLTILVCAAIWLALCRQLKLQRLVGPKAFLFSGGEPMKLRSLLACAARGVLALAISLLATGSTFAQDDRIPRAAAGGFFGIFFVFMIVMYVYFALAIQTIANKTNTENAWLAWIPIINLILLLNIAKKPIWWFILFLIPLVGIVIAVLVWMGVAEARGKPNWWGILMIVPLVNVIVPGYLAWAD